MTSTDSADFLSQHRPRFEWAAFKALMPYLWPRDRAAVRLRVVSSLALLIATKAAAVYVPILFSEIVDQFSNPSGAVVALPAFLIAAYCLVRFASYVCAELRDFIFTKVTQSAMRTVSFRTFRHLHQLSLSFHISRPTGAVAAAIQRGTRGIFGFLNVLLFNILPTLVEVALVCVILWVSFNGWYASITFVSIASYAAFTLLVTNYLLPFNRKALHEERRASTRSIDSLLNYETVKYFGREDLEAARYDEALAGYETNALGLQRATAFLRIGQGAIIATALAVLVTMAANGVVNETMSVGGFVLVNSYLLQLYVPLNFLGQSYRFITSSLLDMEGMFNLLHVDPDIKDSVGARPRLPGPGVIEFDHVCFSYDHRRHVLHDVTFSVPAGKRLAIVGSSGSGKSTIGRLLFRFFDVDSGSIRIDGQDIKHLTQSSLRAAIGVVPQDTVLFNETIYYNIAYGAADATPAEVEQAARQAQIHDFIMKATGGYQARVGERGLRLSGGEKQRVAIARTILKRPPIILLDEATSALDSATESSIQASLRDFARGHTVIAIAHRLSTIVDSDEIIVLEKGRIAERGSHQGLLARDGLYAAMWRRQQDEHRHCEKPGFSTPEEPGVLAAPSALE